MSYFDLDSAIETRLATALPGFTVMTLAEYNTFSSGNACALALKSETDFSGDLARETFTFNVAWRENESGECPTLHEARELVASLFKAFDTPRLYDCIIEQRLQTAGISHPKIDDIGFVSIVCTVLVSYDFDYEMKKEVL